MLYYLNDVEDGGETAFPVADNETFDQEVSIELLNDVKFQFRKLLGDLRDTVSPKT